MSSVKLEVLTGANAGRVLEPDADVIRIGRAPSNELVLAESHVSGEHARLVVGADRVTLEDLKSTNGTTVVRGSQRIVLGEASSAKTLLESGDLLELGGGTGDEATVVRVTLSDDEEPAHVVSVRPISQLTGHTPSAERDTSVLRTLHRVDKRIGSATELEGVLAAVADAALELVPTATHATLVLRDDVDSESSQDEAGYVPVLTRVRGEDGVGRAPEGAVAVTRSVFRKVVRERAAILAADAPRETFSSESLLGASIRSTIGVPLWKGEEILGVVQVDNRASPDMFDSGDLDALGVLAASASLAIANARLVRRLLAAEEQLQKENSFLKGRERARTGAVEIIGQSKAMKDLLGQLEKVVDTRVTVLVEGETGTGKELVASSVHYRSRRKAKLFVAQNCAALPENLLESELFGHKRGAFTGATEEKRGLFDIADGGTLFLDEVTEMPLALQAKLLRVLQEGEIRPVGATHTKHVDVRIVAACNRNLEKEVEAGRFREDLYYRLKVFPLRVPALRERRDDVPLLAGFFLEKYSKEIGKPVAGFSQGAMELLMSYDWPGNVRELENEVQRLVIQADPDGFVSPDMLSPRVRRLEGVIAQAGAAKGTLKEMVEQVEKYLILECLREHGNNKTSAAKTLGITREGLHKKLRQLGIG
jgi:transcriptional regulator with GAF, ATPase, and Fis domain